MEKYDIIRINAGELMCSLQLEKDGILLKMGVMYWHFRDDPVRIWKGNYADAVNPEDNPKGLLEDGEVF